VSKATSVTAQALGVFIVWHLGCITPWVVPWWRVFCSKRWH